jgi:alpha-tubulin suppressor-like RCC1 family protein
MKTKIKTVLAQIAFVLALLSTLNSQLATAFATPTVTKVAGGFDHTLFLLSNGSLWGIGFNSYGQLGDGTTSNRYSPYEIASSNVIAMAAGYEHTLFVKSDGSLWVIGGNDFGQLGDGATTNHFVPEEIVSNGVTAVAAGFYHSLFLKSDGSLWGMGYYADGELGISGTGSSTNIPVKIVSANVAQVAAGDWHSLFITTDGSLWGMGYDAYGQLGDNSVLNTYLPEEVVTNHSVFTGLTAIAGGGLHSLYLYNQIGQLGQLWAMGDNQYGELGNGSTNTSYVPFQIVASGVNAIAAGFFHSLFIKNDGSLWAMGENQFGQLGNATLTDTNTPQEILSSNVTAVAAGAYHSLFIKSDGSLWGMGDDEYGQLGDSTLLNASVPERIYPPRLLVIAGLSLSGTNLIVHGTNELTSGSIWVLASTNLALPVNQWTSIWTNPMPSGAFNLTVSNAVNATIPQRFFRLQLFQIN